MKCKHDFYGNVRKIGLRNIFSVNLRLAPLAGQLFLKDRCKRS